MRKAQTVVSSFVLFFAFVCNCLQGQNTKAESQPVGIALSIAVQKSKVPAGQSPIVIFGVENLGPREIAVHDYIFHVEGENGEPETTYIQRLITHKLRTGEAEMRADAYAVWTIMPGTSEDRKIKVSELYDVSSPGKYTAYVEVMDPSSKKWVRTRTVKFEIEPV